MGNNFFSLMIFFWEADALDFVEISDEMFANDVSFWVLNALLN